jgi:hypothetical protein
MLTISGLSTGSPSSLIENACSMSADCVPSGSASPRLNFSTHLSVSRRPPGARKKERNAERHLNFFE